MPKNFRRSGSLGRRTLEKDVEVLRVASNTYGGAGQGTDHGTLTGRSDDDHTQYAHLSQAESVVGQWDFAPGAPQAPFTLGANAQGQLVTGLNADELDGSDWTTIASDLVPLTVDTYDLGSSVKLWRKGYLSELEALLFVEESIHVEGGWLIVGHDQGTLNEDVDNSQTTIDFGDGMTQNDFVLMRAFLQVEYIQVGTLVSGTTYNVTRNVDGSGANTWPEGTVYLVLGNTGDGRIELVANQSDAPRISILEQGATYNAQTERVRIGNMRDSFGVGSNNYYGFGVGDYSGGNYFKYNDTDGFFFSAGAGKIRITSAGIDLQEMQGITWYADGGWTTEIGNILSYYGSSTNWFVRFGADSGVVRVDLKETASLGPHILIRGPTIQVNDGTTATEFNIHGGLFVGATGTGLSTDNDIRAYSDIVAGSGFYAGDADGNPDAGCFVGLDDLRIDGGISVGDSTRAVASGYVIVDGRIYINESTNSKLTYGLTINSGTATDEQISLKGSDVGHGMFTDTETDTAAYLKRINANGGLSVVGWAETDLAMVIQANYTTGVTTKSGSAGGGIRLQSRKKSGSTVGAPASNENIVHVRAHTTTVFIIDKEGDVHIPTGRSYTNWDDHDDIKLLTAARMLSLDPNSYLRTRFQDWIEYAKPILQETGVITFNDDGNHFMSQKGMTYLMIDTMRQMHEKILQLEARNESNN